MGTATIAAFIGGADSAPLAMGAGRVLYYRGFASGRCPAVPCQCEVAPLGVRVGQTPLSPRVVLQLIAEANPSTKNSYY